jgi:hypothetical protein
VLKAVRVEWLARPKDIKELPSSLKMISLIKTTLSALLEKNPSDGEIYLAIFLDPQHNYSIFFKKCISGQIVVDLFKINF